MVRPRFWECPRCEETEASGGETDSSDDEGGDIDSFRLDDCCCRAGKLMCVGLLMENKRLR